MFGGESNASQQAGTTQGVGPGGAPRGGAGPRRGARQPAGRPGDPMAHALEGLDWNGGNLRNNLVPGIHLILLLLISLALNYIQKGGWTNDLICSEPLSDWAQTGDHISLGLSDQGTLKSAIHWMLDAGRWMLKAGYIRCCTWMLKLLRAGCGQTLQEGKLSV